MTLLDERWLLPEGVEETLPPTAEHLERARRDLLDLYSSWGYRLVTPPLVEHLDSLLVGAGTDLEQQIFKLTDPISGRLIGVRADMTPQVARIDARHMPQDSPARLCYLGTTLRTHAEGLSASRSPVQVGAEIFGHAGIESDCEAMCLMAATLACLRVGDVHLDLGHVGVFRCLVERAGLDSNAELALLEAMQRKAGDDVAEVLQHVDDAVTREHLSALIDLNGGSETLALAREVLSAADEKVFAYLDDLEQLIALLKARGIDLPVHIDLAELRGYRYHTGVVFAAFVPGQGQEVARGGRYDDIERVYGAPRAATGFSSDLKSLIALADVHRQAVDKVSLIEAPWSDDEQLLKLVNELRNADERVVFALPGSVRADGVSRAIRQDNSGTWTVETLNMEQTPK